MAEDVIFCVQCGKKLPVTARFCSQCGSPIQPLEPDASQVDAGYTDLKCPYCENPMQVASGVTSLICLECAASLKVERSNGQVSLIALRF